MGKPKAMPKPKEADVLRSVLGYLTLRKVWHRRINSGATKIGKRFIRFGSPGFPDIVAIRSMHPTAIGLLGLFVAIEVKKPLGKRGGTGGSEQSPEQVQMQKEIEAAGGVYILARSVQDVIDAGL